MAAKGIASHVFYWLIIAAGVYALLPFVIIAQYNYPCADDFAGAVRDAQHSFLFVLRDSYMHWSGRYFAIAVARVNPLLYHSFAAYHGYAIMLLMAFVGALVVLVRAMTAEYFSWRQTVSLASMLLVLYLAVLPSTSEGFYWFSGSYIYQTANVLFMLWLALLVKLPSIHGHLARLLCFATAFVLAVCIIGSNEISMIITCAMVVAFAYNHYRMHKAHDGLLIALALVCFCAACFAVLAPGNFERMNDAQEYAKSPAWAFKGAIAVTFLYIIQWALPLLAATVLYVPLFGQQLAKAMFAKGVNIPVKWQYAAIVTGAIFILLQFFAIWAAGGSNLGRIENVAYLFFLLGWFFNVQLYINQHAHNKLPQSLFSKAMLALVLLLFWAGVLDINNNISTAYIDLLSGKAQIYSREQIMRMQTAKRCIHDTCYVPPVTTIPKTIFFTDLKSKPDSVDFWMNKAYAAYLGTPFVIVTDNLPPVQPNIETLRSMGKGLRQRIFTPVK